MNPFSSSTAGAGYRLTEQRVRADFALYGFADLRYAVVQGKTHEEEFSCRYTGVGDKLLEDGLIVQVFQLPSRWTLNRGQRSEQVAWGEGPRTKEYCYRFKTKLTIR